MNSAEAIPINNFTNSIEDAKESRFSKILYNQISLLLAIISLFAAVFATQAYLRNPTQELSKDLLVLQTEFNDRITLTEQLEKIKSNDLHAIELKQKEQDQKLENLLIEVIKIQTMIEESRLK